MKRRNRIIIATGMLAIGMLAGTAMAGGRVDTLTVIHVNDSHSNLTPYGAAEVGGIARAASVIGMWKAANPNPILVHGGDFMVGTLMFNAYFGVPELQILNALGFDALCLGNHEFDVGPVRLSGIIAQAGIDSAFNILCTNAVNLDSVPALKAVVRPYAVERRGNIKVGLLGLTTPAANVESNPAPVVLSDTIEDILGQRIMQLKAVEGCQVVILISHMGLMLDEQIAQALSGVDAIISAHSHDALKDVISVNGIPIVQAGEFYHYVGKLRLAYDGVKTSVVDYELQEINSAIPAEPTIQATVDQLKLGVTAQFGPVIGDPFQKITVAPKLLNYKPFAFDTLDTPMGNLVTTAMLDFVKNADCAMEATGHIVENLNPGPVTAADLFRAYPYGYDASDGLGFRLASFDLTGAQIRGVLQALLGFVDPQTLAYDYLIQSTGLDMAIDKTHPKEGLKLTAVRIKGNPVHPDSIYSIASSSQIVGYLQKLFQIQPANLTLYPVSVFQVIKEYASRHDTLRFRSDNHNTPVQEKKIGAVRGFNLEQNYPNPFNGETVFRFNLPRSAAVTFEIFNVNGERIAAPLTDRSLDAGGHTVRFNAASLSSGVYVYRVKSEGFAESRKMMLLR
jgi:5'-nucleotidase/UDP-sugar diphosphatase